MKLIYLSVDGTATIENHKIRTRQIEMPDGNHPITNDSVWQDTKRRGPPVMIIVQGVTGPYGASMAKEDIYSVVYEMKSDEINFRPQSISKMWHRALARFFSWFLIYGLPITVIFLVIYMLVNQVVFGGV